jgi:hypothetical protein
LVLVVLPEAVVQQLMEQQVVRQYLAALLLSAVALVEVLRLRAVLVELPVVEVASQTAEQAQLAVEQGLPIRVTPVALVRDSVAVAVVVLALLEVMPTFQHLTEVVQVVTVLLQAFQEAQ